MSEKYHSTDFYNDKRVNSTIVDISNETNNHPSYYLRLRDLQTLVGKFAPENKKLDELNALDYGCGAGRPTRHLKKIGLKKTIGCDINESLVKLAREHDPSGEYIQLDPPKNLDSTNQKLLPFENDRFDFVLSCMVYFEIPSEKSLENMINETSRVMRQNGYYYVIVCPKELYSLEANRKWKFFNQNFPENVNLTSGRPFKLEYFGCVYCSFYWEDEDIKRMCEKVGLIYKHTHDVFGKDDEDGVEWLDEKIVAPYKILIFRKD